MAKHEILDLKNRPLTSYINDSRLHRYAVRAADLLAQLPQLKVWEVQYKGKGVANTCWYVSTTEFKEPFLLNFTLIPSNLNVEFRFSQYLPPDDFERLKWQNSSWRYADLTTYGAQTIQGMIERYLANIEDDLAAGRLKQGGKSFAEKMIERCLRAIYPDAEILMNRRPDELRSAKGKPLELDLYLPAKRLAIEVQGPQHFKAIYGCNAALQANDQRKKDWCGQNGIRLVWMNWEGVNRDLLKLPFKQQVDLLAAHLTELLDSQYRFLWWQDRENQHQE